MRTFVALRCGAAVTRRLRAAAERLAAVDGAFRAPRTDDFHTTLQFLGSTGEGDVAGIARALEEAARAVEGPLDVAYGPLGAFPTAERARVVWAGVRTVDGDDALGRLARAVGEALAPLGYPPERRAWHGHVTLGRVRRRPSRALVDAVRAGADADLGAETVSDLNLILSDPGSGQYHYIDLTTIPLGGSRRA